MDSFESKLDEIIQIKRKEIDSKLFERNKVKEELRKEAINSASNSSEVKN
jgi:hypothetical protein